MAPKAFKLTFDYTPRWKNNDKRVPDEQFTVALKDFPERKRIEFREQLVAKIPTVDDPKLLVAYQKEELEFKERLVLDNIVSVNGLSIEGSDGTNMNVKTAEDLIKFCPEVATEIANRLMNGPGADELKN